MAVITALTAQNTVGVRAVHAPDAAFVDAQIAAIAEDCPPAATKTGMLFSAEIVDVVARWAARGALGRLVVDPVMVATSGDRLLRPDAEAAVRTRLLSFAEIVTPNLAELEVLSGRRITGLDAAVEAARALVASGVAAVLVKGGHGPADDVAEDVLVRRDAPPRSWRRARLPLLSTHGTGCTLSAALAAELALGRDLEAAVGAAGDFVHAGLRTAFAVGSGAVPVNHLHATSRRDP